MRRSAGASSSARRRSASLRDADPETHLEITDTFARWDRVDIRYQDRVLQLARPLVLGDRAASGCWRSSRPGAARLGVDLVFGAEVQAISEADLVVGAGRREQRSSGGSATSATKIEPEGCKYVWFGTDHVFDAFTFVFKESEHGLYNAHAYPYDERHDHLHRRVSLRDVARCRARGDRSEEENLAFCEQLFARDLRGRELFSNRSIWLDFAKVTNRVWHDGRVVLIGDAAHTAHFSIGSGTKLAMEDSIALANALRAAWLGCGRRARRLRARTPAARRANAGGGERAAPATSGAWGATRTSSRSSSRSTC